MCVCLCVYVCVSVCTYVHMCVCVCTYVYSIVRTYNFIALCWNVCVYLGWAIFQCITHIAIARCAIINITDILHVSNIAYAICNSYNTGKSALPDIYARYPRVRSARGRVRIYQAKHECLCYN